MNGTVFFADILGFCERSKSPEATGAADALNDVAAVLASNDDLARYLHRNKWRCRYGLSDSLFLVAEQTEAACAAAAELFFSLAFLNASSPDCVLMRGGIATGQYRELGPIFPETGKGNLVGHAVVEAVELEKTKVKGPRLFVSESVAAEVAQEPSGWLLKQQKSQPTELLWLLPPKPDEANGTMIGEVCSAAVEQFVRHAHRARAGLHHAGYLDLVVSSLERFFEQRPDQAVFAARLARFERIATAVADPAVGRLLDEWSVVDRIEKLKSQFQPIETR